MSVYKQGLNDGDTPNPKRFPNCIYYTTTGDGGVKTMLRRDIRETLWVMPLSLLAVYKQECSGLNAINVESLHKVDLTPYAVIGICYHMPREGTQGYDRLLAACQGRSVRMTASVIYTKMRFVEAHKLFVASANPKRVEQYEWLLAPQGYSRRLVWRFVRRNRRKRK